MTKERAIELLKGVQFCCDLDDCTNAWDCEECDDELNMAIEALEQQTDEIVRCKDCKYWHEWETGAGSCHRSDIMWVGSDYCDYCSFAEKRGSDER